MTENSCGIKRTILGNKDLTDKEKIRAIVKSYKDYLSIRQIMNMRTLLNSEISKDFSFTSLAARNEIKQLLQSLNVKTTCRKKFNPT